MREVRRLAGHQSHVAAIAFSADGKTLVSGSADASAALWDLAQRKQRHRLVPGTGVIAVGLTPNARTVYSGDWAGKVHAWDTRTGKEGRAFETKQGYFGRIAFAPDGKVMASWANGSGQRISLRDLATGQELRQITSAAPWVNALAFSPDSKLLAVGTGQGPPFLTLWEVSTGRRLHQFEKQSWTVSLAFSPDGRTLASGHNDGQVRIWEVASGGMRHAFDHGERPAALAFSPDGSLLASACNESGSNPATNGFTRALDVKRKDEDKVRVWDPHSGARLQTLAGHRGAVACLAFSPAGTLLASGSNDTTVLLWDASRLPRPARPKVAPLGARELEACWSNLAAADAGPAYRSMRHLLATPRQAVELIGARLRPAAAADAKRLAALIADLDGNEFATREQATKELAELGAKAEPALRKVLAGKPSLEVHRRVERLLGRLEREQLGMLRAVEVLERIGTAEARKLLSSLARGTAGARLTEEARVALGRLAARR